MSKSSELFYSEHSNCVSEDDIMDSGRSDIEALSCSIETNELDDTSSVLYDPPSQLTATSAEILLLLGHCLGVPTQDGPDNLPDNGNLLENSSLHGSSSELSEIFADNDYSQLGGNHLLDDILLRSIEVLNTPKKHRKQHRSSDNIEPGTSKKVKLSKAKKREVKEKKSEEFPQASGLSVGEDIISNQNDNKKSSTGKQRRASTGKQRRARTPNSPNCKKNVSTKLPRNRNKKQRGANSNALEKRLQCKICFAMFKNGRAFHLHEVSHRKKTFMVSPSKDRRNYIDGKNDTIVHTLKTKMSNADENNRPYNSNDKQTPLSESNVSSRCPSSERVIGNCNEREICEVLSDGNSEDNCSIVKAFTTSKSLVGDLNFKDSYSESTKEVCHNAIELDSSPELPVVEDDVHDDEDDSRSDDVTRHHGLSCDGKSLTLKKVNQKPGSFVERPTVTCEEIPNNYNNMKKLNVETQCVNQLESCSRTLPIKAAMTLSKRSCYQGFSSDGYSSRNGSSDDDICLGNNGTEYEDESDDFGNTDIHDDDDDEIDSKVIYTHNENDCVDVNYNKNKDEKLNENRFFDPVTQNLAKFSKDSPSHFCARTADFNSHLYMMHQQMCTRVLTYQIHMQKKSLDTCTSDDCTSQASSTLEECQGHIETIVQGQRKRIGQGYREEGKFSDFSKKFNSTDNCARVNTFQHHILSKASDEVMMEISESELNQNFKSPVVKTNCGFNSVADTEERDQGPRSCYVCGENLSKDFEHTNFEDVLGTDACYYGDEQERLARCWKCSSTCSRVQTYQTHLRIRKSNETRKYWKLSNSQFNDGVIKFTNDSNTDDEQEHSYNESCVSGFEAQESDNDGIDCSDSDSMKTKSISAEVFRDRSLGQSLKQQNENKNFGQKYEFPEVEQSSSTSLKTFKTMQTSLERSYLREKTISQNISLPGPFIYSSFCLDKDYMNHGTQTLSSTEEKDCLMYEAHIDSGLSHSDNGISHFDGCLSNTECSRSQIPSERHLLNFEPLRTKADSGSGISYDQSGFSLNKLKDNVTLNGTAIRDSNSALLSSRTTHSSPKLKQNSQSSRDCVVHIQKHVICNNSLLPNRSESQNQNCSSNLKSHKERPDYLTVRRSDSEMCEASVSPGRHGMPYNEYIQSPKKRWCAIFDNETKKKHQFVNNIVSYDENIDVANQEIDLSSRHFDLTNENVCNKTARGHGILLHDSCHIDCRNNCGDVYDCNLTEYKHYLENQTEPMRKDVEYANEDMDIDDYLSVCSVESCGVDGVQTDVSDGQTDHCSRTRQYKAGESNVCARVNLVSYQTGCSRTRPISH